MSQKLRVLVMGKAGSGKTSIRSIIFANYPAWGTRRLAATIEVEHSHVRVLGKLVLNLWDCGGQDAFMDSYLTSQREHIFGKVGVLVYVFDVASQELQKDIHYYQSCLEAILQFSPEAKVFCLIHKMDMVRNDLKDAIIRERVKDIKKVSQPLDCICFATSIWDDTLYKAWSSIVSSLIPNARQFEESLETLTRILDADEVMLFEKTSFLVISHCELNQHQDAGRFEKITNIIKQFKHSCGKVGVCFEKCEVRNRLFAAFIHPFTPNTFIMIVTSMSGIASALVELNIKIAEKEFEKLDVVDDSHNPLITGKK